MIFIIKIYIILRINYYIIFFNMFKFFKKNIINQLYIYYNILFIILSYILLVSIFLILT